MDMEEVLGRLGFAANALVHIRPWLAPMYAWIASTPPTAYLPLPVLIKLIFRMLIETLGSGAATRAVRINCGGTGATFYADAMASKDRVGIGGYEWVRGRPLIQSPWYSEVIDPQEAPSGTHSPMARPHVRMDRLDTAHRLPAAPSAYQTDL